MIGLHNQKFNLELSKGFYNRKDILENPQGQKLEMISKPKRKWFMEILYYLSLGFYDKRGWKYKVKVLTKEI